MTGENGFRRLLHAGARRLSPRRAMRKMARRWSPADTILLDYPVVPNCRWPLDRPHVELARILNEGRAAYAALLESFLQYSSKLTVIPVREAEASGASPYWLNGWMPALDGVALHSLIGLHRPKRYYEIGSGNSTRFAARAVRDHGCATEILSIDPEPRAEIDALCDRVIRAPAEGVSPELFDALERDDILYVDSSHRSLMNSDVTVVFLEILPRLKPGVLVQIHDITLPYDYPQDWGERYYSEQYLLACYLLARGTRFDIVLPSYHVSFDEQLKHVLDPLWNQESMRGVETHGCSFWLRTR